MPARHACPRWAKRNDHAEHARKRPSEYTDENTYAVGKSASSRTVSDASRGAISATAHAATPPATSDTSVPVTIDDPSAWRTSGYSGKKAADVEL